MAQRLNIEIETRDRQLDTEMFQAASFPTGLPSTGSRVTLSDGSIVEYAGTLERRAFDFPAVMHMVLDLATAAGTGVASNWLYDKLKSRSAKLRINRTEVEITPGLCCKHLAWTDCSGGVRCLDVKPVGG